MQVLYQMPQYYKEIINFLVDTSLEVKLLDGIFKKNNVKSVLDVACGVGRHSIPLFKMGYSVLGIDLSSYQIKQAKIDAMKEKCGANFLLMDANSFSFPNRFDDAICMWTTLGEEPLKYRKVIRNVNHSLKKGGIFIIDNRSWEYIPESREETIRDYVKVNGVKISTHIYDRYTENFRVREVKYDIDGRKIRDLCITHLLKEKDWIAELKEGGFREFEIYHNRNLKRVDKPKHITIVGAK